MNFQIERSKAPAPAPSLDMFAEEDQKTTDTNQENASQQKQDSVGKIPSPHICCATFAWKWFGMWIYNLYIAQF